jgi:hypothetical protein
MRDFRDAKAMAASLRQALSDRSVGITHSESLELISRTFGYDNWNILSARIEAERPTRPAPAPASVTLCCSFCGKSRHDVAALIAGPAVHICNECVGLCDGVLVDLDISKAVGAARARTPDVSASDLAAEALAGHDRAQLEAARRSGEGVLQHLDWSLRQVTAAQARAPGEPWGPDETARKRGWTRDPLEGKSPEEISDHKAALERQRAALAERLRLIDEALAARGG